jgi:ABC-type branched-subunit amino acid transport system ATPase component
MLALEARDIRKSFGPVVAIDSAGIDVARGEVHGLIGPNGSGKSTLLHVIAGRTPADAGTVHLDDRDISRCTPTQRARRGLSIKFQLARVYGELTAQDNVLLALQSRQSLASLVLSLSRKRLRIEAEQRLTMFGLEAIGGRRAAELSHGEQQWLEIAMAMATEPSVLLLDEPTGGMNREERARTGELIRASAERCAVVIVEHDLDFIRGLCDRITVMHQGIVVACGTPAEVAEDARVAEVYLTRV